MTIRYIKTILFRIHQHKLCIYRGILCALKTHSGDPLFSQQVKSFALNISTSTWLTVWHQTQCYGGINIQLSTDNELMDLPQPYNPLIFGFIAEIKTYFLHTQHLPTYPVKALRSKAKTYFFFSPPLVTAALIRWDMCQMKNSKNSWHGFTQCMWCYKKKKKYYDRMIGSSAGNVWV